MTLSGPRNLGALVTRASARPRQIYADCCSPGNPCCDDNGIRRGVRGLSGDLSGVLTPFLANPWLALGGLILGGYLARKKINLLSFIKKR
jgi:hypothetical protein